MMDILGKLMELVFIVILGVFSLRAIQEMTRKGGWLERNFDFTALVIVLLIFVFVGFVFVETFLDLVGSADSPDETNADKTNTYKTIGHYVFQNPLVLAALIGFPILIKRVGENRLQSRATQYNAANELLWSSDLGSRMAGIDALWRVAQTYPKEEYHNVMDVFSQFVKNPVSYEWEKGTKKKDQKAGERKDITAILRHMSEERMAGAVPYKIDLQGVYLRRVHLEGADLRGAHLEGADLRGAHLEKADLRGAHLEEAGLRGAHLEGADLQGAHLEGADLKRAHLEEAILWDVHLAGADLRGVHLEGADLTDAHLERADLRDAHLGGAYLWDVHLGGADLRDAHLEGAYLWDAHLDGADLTDAHLEGANLWHAYLTLTIINGADFADVVNLKKKQIKKSVFITDHKKSKKKPQLPEGIKHTYRQLSFKEWEDERKRKFHHFEP